MRIGLFQNPRELVRWISVYLLVASALSTQLGGGCLATTNEDRYNDRPHPNYDNDRLPSNARLIKQGRGELTFRAESTGRVYILNDRTREIIRSEDLYDGDTFTLLPDDNRIRINREEKKLELKRDDVHRLYFDGRRTSGAHDKPDKPTEIKRPVPDTAKTVAETSRGGELSYKASSNGKAYFYDNSNNVLVETFNIKKGQRLTINVDQGIGTLDGKQVLKKSLSRRATYRLLFDD